MTFSNVSAVSRILEEIWSSLIAQWLLRSYKFDVNLSKFSDRQKPQAEQHNIRYIFFFQINGILNDVTAPVIKPFYLFMYCNLQIVAQGVWDTIFNIYSCIYFMTVTCFMTVLFFFVFLST